MSAQEMTWQISSVEPAQQVAGSDWPEMRQVRDSWSCRCAAWRLLEVEAEAVAVRQAIVKILRFMSVYWR